MVNIPVAIANALSSAMLPNIAAAKARGDQSGILNKAQMTVKVTMIIAIPCTVGLAVLGGPVIQLIFGTSALYPELAGDLLLYGSAFVLFFALSTVTNALLQATDYLRYPVTHSIIALIIHTVLAFALLWFFDLKVWSLMISTVAFAVVLCVLNGIVLYRKVRFRIRVRDTILIPLAAAGCMGVMCWGSYYILHYLTKSNTIGFLISFTVGIITYFVALFLFNGITEEELESVPKGQLLVRIAKKLRLLPQQEEE